MDARCDTIKDSRDSASAASMAWGGTWRGSFGARSDMVIVIRDGAVAAASFLGQDMALTRCEITGDQVVLSGPDGAVTLLRVGPAGAQATYVNNRGKKATALLSLTD